MKRFVWCLALVALGAAALPLAPAQEATEEPGGAKIEALVERLGADDYRSRDAALEELRGLGEKARPYLEGARNHEDPEIRWRSRRLLRALDRDAARRATAREDGSVDGRAGGDSAPGGERLRGPWRRLPGGFGNEPFRGLDGWLERFDERFGALLDDPWGRGRGFSWPDDPRIRELMERLRQQNRRLFEGLEPWGVEPFGIVPPEAGAGDPPDGARFTSLTVTIEENGERIEFRYDPDSGATATITREGQDGPDDVETYRADDLATFRRAHPELARKLGLDRFSVRIGDGPQRGFRFARPSEPEAPSPRRLGVLCGELPEVVRRHLSLDEGQGILVEEVEPGSLAEKLGMAAYDILLRLNDRTVGRPGDVAMALAELEPGVTVRVEVIRAGDTKKLEARY